MELAKYIKEMGKALLIIGSALTLICCDAISSSSKNSVVKEPSGERVLSETSRNLTVVMSTNGRPSYLFTAPLVEGYTLGLEPYREFREGVEIETFTNDSLNVRDSRLTAEYAIYYEKRQLWEARGDVQVKKSDGRQLYSEQLFWNAQTKRIFSNVDTKIVDINSGDIYQGEGFESDEAMDDWSFRRLTGKLKMEMSQQQQGESESENENRVEEE